MCGTPFWKGMVVSKMFTSMHLQFLHPATNYLGKAFAMIVCSIKIPLHWHCCSHDFLLLNFYSLDGEILISSTNYYSFFRGEKNQKSDVARHESNRSDTQSETGSFFPLLARGVADPATSPALYTL